MDKYDKKSPTSYAIGLTVCFEAMEFGTFIFHPNSKPGRRLLGS